MKIISAIEDEQVIEKILKHLGLWDQKARPPPKANAPPMAPEYHIDYTDSQIPVPARHCTRAGIAGGYDNLSRASRSNDYLYVDPQYLSEA